MKQPLPPQKNKKTAINFDNTEWDLFAEESGLEVHAG